MENAAPLQPFDFDLLISGAFFSMRLLVQTKVDSETRVGLVDDSGRLWEYHREYQRAGGTLVGNIYLGRVVNVEPAIQAAFIDIGENRTAFLHFADLHPAYDLGES
ncbi:MAG: hypothetical protein ACPG1Z_11775, partial [Planctomycetota bacterium]